MDQSKLFLISILFVLNSVQVSAQEQINRKQVSLQEVPAFQAPELLPEPANIQIDKTSVEYSDFLKMHLALADKNPFDYTQKPNALHQLLLDGILSANGTLDSEIKKSIKYFSDLLIPLPYAYYRALLDMKPQHRVTVHASLAANWAQFPWSKSPLFAILEVYKLSSPVALIAAQNLILKEQSNLENGKVYFPKFFEAQREAISYLVLSELLHKTLSPVLLDAVMNSKETSTAEISSKSQTIDQQSLSKDLPWDEISKGLESLQKNPKEIENISAKLFDMGPDLRASESEDIELYQKQLKYEEVRFNVGAGALTLLHFSIMAYATYHYDVPGGFMAGIAAIPVVVGVDLALRSIMTKIYDRIFLKGATRTAPTASKYFAGLAGWLSVETGKQLKEESSYLKFYRQHFEASGRSCSKAHL
jgi:hypothetical protein